MAHLKNLTNEYAAQLEALLDECPKAVLAAIAVSALTSGGDHLEKAKLVVAEEWRALYRAGIVPQRPGKVALETLSHPEVFGE